MRSISSFQGYSLGYLDIHRFRPTLDDLVEKPDDDRITELVEVP